jgi:hypothetical protein
MTTTSNYESFFKDDPWSDIEGPSYPEGRQLYQNDSRFWVSINESGQFQFFVHVKEVVDVKGIESLAGVEISICEFNASSSRLICTLLSDEKEMKQKFSMIAKDIAFYCSENKDSQIFFNVQERIKSWADFLKPSRKGLSKSDFIGFWGELYTLSEILMAYHSPADAVRFWVGPEGKKQDVTLNSIAIEIKTSMSGSPNKVKISSLDQLDRTGDSLYLLHVTASPSTNDVGFSLESLYEKCMGAMSGDLNTETLFLRKIFKFYGKASNGQLNDKLAIYSVNLFHVRDDFPMISRGDISPGIADAEYNIYTAFLESFDVTEHMEDIIRNG